MITITSDILKEIAPGSSKTKYHLLDPLASEMNKQFEAANLQTTEEIRHFLAQAAHETDSFNSLKEYASGKAYELRKDLGNIILGWGEKFKGRGIFMSTGYTNYKRLTDLCHVDGVSFITHPELLETPHWAVWSALLYWNDRHLSDFAVAEDNPLWHLFSSRLKRNLSPIEYITYRINGGFNGLEQRKIFYERAKTIVT